MGAVRLITNQIKGTEAKMQLNILGFPVTITNTSYARHIIKYLKAFQAHLFISFEMVTLSITMSMKRTYMVNYLKTGVHSLNY